MYMFVYPTICVCVFTTVFNLKCLKASYFKEIASGTERTAHVDSVFDEDIKQQYMNDHSLLYLGVN